jgi:hypothetical protein
MTSELPLSDYRLTSMVGRNIDSTLIYHEPVKEL